MGVKGGNLAVPTIPKADNAEMKVEKHPTSHTANGYIRHFGRSAMAWKFKSQSNCKIYAERMKSAT